LADPIHFSEVLGDGALQAALRHVPMFPLPGVVLFPHALLPLHIFEDRYRAMTRDVLAGARFLVVSLIAPGESLATERPAVQRVAGVGEIVMAHELPDGRYNLVVRGRARVRIDEELASDRPYRVVAGTTLPDLPVADAAELSEADGLLRVLVGRLAEVIPEGGELLRQVVAAQGTPTELVDVVASALVDDATVRQRLLETRDVGKRLERVASEVVAMTARIRGSTPLN
jgi:Lon protease-like protein